MRNRNYVRESSFNKSGNVENDVILKSIIDAEDCYNENRLEQANYLYQQILQSDPNNIQALNGLGMIAMQAGMMSLAIEFLSNACEMAPENMLVNKNLALAYTKMSRYDDAILQYLGMLDIEESNSEIHGELARLNLQLGHFDLALKFYRHALYLTPEEPQYLHGVVKLDVKSITKEDLETVENILDSPELPLAQRCEFYFALGDIYDDFSLYDEAFANYSVANMCKVERFDSDQYTDYVSNIIDIFSSDFFENSSLSELNSSSQPVFIVGMPHSGGALVEQMLASHTDVYTAGESTLIDDFSQKLDIANDIDKDLIPSINYITADSLNDLAQFYLNSINNLAVKDDHTNPLVISNKLQFNFTNLGLIALLFPNARIIDCRRNPLDVCLSCFFQNLSDKHIYSRDLKEAALYYQQYEQLMEHWKKVLPIDIYTVDYEDVISDTEKSSRQLIDYVGLDWQEQCLDFYNTKRHVNIDNPVQLKHGVYKSSINRWQHYENHIHLLKKTLNMPNSIFEGEELVSINPHDFRKDYKVSKHMR